MTNASIWLRGGGFLAWCLLYLGLTAVIGMLPAMIVFLFTYLRFGGRESMSLSMAITLGMGLFAYVLFHWILVVPWPDALLGDLLPELRSIRATRLF